MTTTASGADGQGMETMTLERIGWKLLALGAEGDAVYEVNLQVAVDEYQARRDALLQQLRERDQQGRGTVTAEQRQALEVSARNTLIDEIAEHIQGPVKYTQHAHDLSVKRMRDALMEACTALGLTVVPIDRAVTDQQRGTHVMCKRCGGSGRLLLLTQSTAWSVGPCAMCNAIGFVPIGRAVAEDATGGGA